MALAKPGVLRRLAVAKLVVSAMDHLLKLRRPRVGNRLEGLASFGKNGVLAGHLLPAADDAIDVARIELKPGGPSPGDSAAITVVPLPRKGSRISPLRFEQSLMASATSATGLTVGCMASAASRPAPKLLTPG